MSIGVVDRKLLWGRSHNQCAYPGCRQALTVNLGDPESRLLGDAGAVLGEEAHIRSGSVGGPRYDPNYQSDRIDCYANLILLCPTHHALADKDGGKAFSVADLESMRADHESAMQSQESSEDELARVMAERTAASVALWEEMISPNDWQNLTWGLNRPVPTISSKRLDSLHQCGEWLLAKDWPVQYPHVRRAFEHFLDALRPLLEHLFASFEPYGDSARRLARPYKSIPWNPDRYATLLREVQVDAMTTWVLVVELSRAANLVIAATRIDVDPLYRFDEGVLLAREGDGIFENRAVRVEYTGDPWERLDRIGSLGEIKTKISETARATDVEPDELNPYTFDLRPPQDGSAITP